MSQAEGYGNEFKVVNIQRTTTTGTKCYAKQIGKIIKILWTKKLEKR